MGRKDLPPGIGATDRILGTVKVGATVLQTVGGTRLPLVYVEVTSAAASAPDKHQPQPKLHLTLEQACELAKQLLAAAELVADTASDASSGPQH